MRKFLVLALVLVLGLGVARAVDLRTKVGQMVIVGLQGTTFNDEEMNTLARNFVGGVVLFEKNLSDTSILRNIENPEQVLELTTLIQRVTPHMALICVDQEGGQVSRLNPKRGFIPTRSAASIGAINNPDTTARVAGEMADQLAALGFNVNFAPCVDLAVNPANPIASRGRTFSASPDTVVACAEIYVREHQKRNVLTSLKHFPGHGSSITDSHNGFTDVTKTYTQAELEPYRRMIAGGYDQIIMVGHTYNANYDSIYPASLSKATIDGLLRKELGFKGVVITDDMGMSAITKNYKMPDALALAINAGVDMILMGNNSTTYDSDVIRKTINTIYKLVTSGKIPEARINEAYDRIVALKAKLKK